MFTKAGVGWDDLNFRGNFNEEEYSYNSDRLIVLAKKAG